ncbi:hypothetical protein Vadar_022831 [Vaccinium darrowii]|uniref:Uncharacterized protein n=1 Tax=Vaccinium darrowii TaxID=229202 RepID=A0ACB7XBU9_9ERIC|nr:hypothetical protein Vadar_022831 [Vaccinium darrowii]
MRSATILDWKKRTSSIGTLQSVTGSTGGKNLEFLGDFSVDFSSHRAIAIPVKLIRFISYLLTDRRNVSLMESSSVAAFLMFSLSCGESDEHSSPIWKTETKHAVSSLLLPIEHPTSVIFSVSSALCIAD